jgi:hypothetical protein
MNLDRAGAYVGPTIVIKVAADQLDARTFEHRAARRLSVEIGGGAVRVQLAKADEDSAAGSSAGLFARAQIGGGGRNGRTDKRADQQPRSKPQRGNIICHFVRPSKQQTFARPHRSVNRARACHVAASVDAGRRRLEVPSV